MGNKTRTFTFIFNIRSLWGFTVEEKKLPLGAKSIETNICHGTHRTKEK